MAGQDPRVQNKAIKCALLEDTAQPIETSMPK